MFRMVLACVALASTAFACAPLSKTGMQSISTEQQSLVNAMCSQVMGLWSGEVYFHRCQESLANVLAAKAQREAVDIAFKECAQRDLEEGSAAFSTCMLNSKSKAAVPEPLTATYADDPDIEAGKGFDEIAPRIRMNRERYACAQLGLLPGSNPFDGCIFSLEDAFMPPAEKPFDNLYS